MAVTKSGIAIELGYARKLVDNFGKNKIGNTLATDETRAVWFSKEMMLEALGLDPATDTNGITGLRIYLGAYEEKQGYPENSFDNNKITLVVVQTGDEKIMIDRGGVSEEAYLDIIKEPEAQPSYPGDTPSPTEKTTFNDGQVCPPPPLGTGFGLMDW